MKEGYKNITNSKNKTIEIYLPGFISLEGSINGHATIWWKDEEGNKQSMVTLKKTSEILEIL